MWSIALAAVAAAQSPADQPVTPSAETISAMPATASCCVLKALTPVYLVIDEPLDSDKSAIGQYFKLSLRQPVEIAPGLVIPPGTPGAGQVVHAAKSRAMGKAGELVLAARFLDFQGMRVPLRSLRYGSSQGKDNVETAAIVGIAVSAVIAPFITGGEVRIPTGTEVWAKVAADVPLQALEPAEPLPNAAGNNDSNNGVK